MFIPKRNYSPTLEDTADIMLNSHKYFGFCTKFKYLGTWFDASLNDSLDVKQRIQKAAAAFAMISNVLKNKKIDPNYEYESMTPQS